MTARQMDVASKDEHFREIPLESKLYRCKLLNISEEVGRLLVSTRPRFVLDLRAPLAAASPSGPLIQTGGCLMSISAGCPILLALTMSSYMSRVLRSLTPKTTATTRSAAARSPSPKPRPSASSSSSLYQPEA